MTRTSGISPEADQPNFYLKELGTEQDRTVRKGGRKYVTEKQADKTKSSSKICKLWASFLEKFQPLTKSLKKLTGRVKEFISLRGSNFDKEKYETAFHEIEKKFKETASVITLDNLEKQVDGKIQEIDQEIEQLKKLQKKAKFAIFISGNITSTLQEAEAAKQRGKELQEKISDHKEFLYDKTAEYVKQSQKDAADPTIEDIDKILDEIEAENREKSRMTETEEWKEKTHVTYQDDKGHVMHIEQAVAGVKILSGELAAAKLNYLLHK